MKQAIFTFTILIAFYSCSSSTNKESDNKDLIAFKTKFLAEIGSDEYFKLERELKKEKIEVKYLNDIIYISYLEDLNACGKYDGNIEITGDSIKLKIKLISDEVCSSKSIDRITFIIDNPDEKKKHIVKSK